MKYCRLFALSFGFVASLSAAELRWDVVVSEKSSGYQLLGIKADVVDPWIWSMFEYSVNIKGPNAYIVANPDGTRVLCFAGAWAISSPGEVVDFDTIASRGSYLEHDLVGYEMHDEGVLSVHTDSLFYLMFMVQDADQCLAYQKGLREAAPDGYFGWAECVVGKDGVFSIANSVIDLDGGAMIVGGGAIPEPTGGWLIAMGFALIGLRRRGCSEF